MNNEKLPRYYYSAGNADGTVSTSRIGADNDAQGMAKVVAMLREVGINSLDGIEVYRSDGVGLTSQQPVRIHPA